MFESYFPNNMSNKSNDNCCISYLVDSPQLGRGMFESYFPNNMSNKNNDNSCISYLVDTPQ